MSTALTNTDAVVKAVRYSVKSRGAWASFVEANEITPQSNIAEISRALASLAYPDDEPTQKKDGERTRFGNAVQAAGNGIRSVLAKKRAGSGTGDKDYVAALQQAVTNATEKGDLDADQILDIVNGVLFADRPSLSAVA